MKPKTFLILWAMMPIIVSSVGVLVCLAIKYVF